MFAKTATLLPKVLAAILTGLLGAPSGGVLTPREPAALGDA